MSNGRSRLRARILRECVHAPSDGNAVSTQHGGQPDVNTQQAAEKGPSAAFHRRGPRPPPPKPPPFGARAKPALEAEYQTVGGQGSMPRLCGCRRRQRRSVPHSSAGFAGATIPGGGVGGGEAPLRGSWRPRPYAQRTESTRTESTPRVRPSGAALHVDLFEQPASSSASRQETGPVTHGTPRTDALTVASWPEHYLCPVARR
jgi:hypothetical protein